MAQHLATWYYLQRSFPFLLIGGAIVASPLPALAQRIPVADDTLGNERSIVSPDEVIRDVPSNRIDGGARRGANLFHSFREFNIDEGRGAYFTDPDGVANIITRVTGGSRSDILGTLGVLGNANLFLINPRGIVFGPNARLDIGGSFISSTADGFVFDNGFTFSATNPQAPPLLTVSVPIGLQYGANPGAIQTQGASLQVPNDQTLMLAGGSVDVIGNPNRYGPPFETLVAPGGRVELAGVAAAGEVGLTQQGQEWWLSVPEGLGRADVAISNDAVVNVRADGGGSIAITARNFTTRGLGTVLVSGIARGLGTVGAQAGDINVNATESVNINASLILNAIQRGSTGKAGNIDISAGTFTLTNGAQVSAITLGQGDAGNITITARDTVSIDGTNDNGFGTALFSSVDRGAVGQGGDIRITTGTLFLINGGQVTASTRRENASLRGGQGNAGDITIMARDSASIDGRGTEGFGSGVQSTIERGAIGQGGDIRITTGTLSLTNGGTLSAEAAGQGDAGSITITADDAMSFSGAGIDQDGNIVGSGAYTSVSPGAIGRGGNIRITADSFSLTNGAQVNVATEGQGRAGNITFNTPRLTVAGNAQVLAQTSSTGNGGSIVVNAPVSVNLRRTNNLSPVLSVETSGAGQAGDITINTPRLTLAEQARITATATATATNLQGGGSITLNASHLNLAGIVGVFAETQGESPAGTLRLNPYRNQPDLEITLTPRSQISASTSGSGNGGDLIVTAPESISITGAGRLAVETSGTGNAGNMQFTTRQLSLSDGVEISASTSGSGQAGDIGINAQEFTLSGRAQVSTNTSSSGAAGDLSVQVGDRLFLTGQGTGLFASTAEGSIGDGGSITIDPNLVQIEAGASIAVDSQGRGTGGNISLQADQLMLDRGSITAETDSAQGGNIELDVSDLTVLRNNSLISATAGTAQAGGDGGNISIDSPFIVAYPNENNDISANAFTGRGGNVAITAQSLFGIEARPQPTPLSDITASSRSGVAGVVDINTPDVDPNRGLVELPADVTDASRLIVQSCPAGSSRASQQNEFIVTGRGGLPPTPDEAVNPDAIQVDLVTTDAEAESSVSQHQSEQQPPIRPMLVPGEPIVEAQGWQVGADGKVMLVATAPESAFNRTDLESIAPSPNALVHCR